MDLLGYSVVEDHEVHEDHEDHEDQEDFVATNTGLDKQKIKESTPAIVAQWLDDNIISPIFLDALSTELRDDRKSLETQYQQTQVLINRLDYVLVSSQQISLGGLKMAKQTLAHLRSHPGWFKTNTSFKQAEIQSINYVLGLTAPIPLGPETNQYGLLQQYAVRLGDALVSQWKAKASQKHKLFFDFSCQFFSKFASFFLMKI